MYLFGSLVCAGFYSMYLLWPVNINRMANMAEARRISCEVVLREQY